MDFNWKRQAVDGQGKVCSIGADDARRHHEIEVRDLHAKIGKLTVQLSPLPGSSNGFGLENRTQRS